MTTAEIAWLAGLLEGEGCILCINASPKIVLGMTDEDVVRRAATLLGGPAVYTRVPKIAHHKVQYWCTISGFRAVEILFTVYTFMGVRRRAKIREVVAKWQAKVSPRNRRLGITNCKHYNRSHYAHGVCHACYEGQRQRRVLAELARVGEGSRV